jgi:hypothetical protein
MTSEVLVSQLSLPWHCLEMSGQLHALPIYPGQSPPCTRGLGGMVGPTFIFAAGIGKSLPLLGIESRFPGCLPRNLATAWN